MGRGSDSPFPVVGLGASAGGLAPLTHLIEALPPNPGLALVVIQHLDPHAESRLSSLLRAHTPMAVQDAVHGAKIEPDHVYVIQPNTDVALVDGMLSVTMRPDAKRPHYPVDHFLRSLASVRGSHAVGVILSGTGSDGALGVCEIKAAGGVTFAQDEHSAQHPGMPQSAIASGAIDLVLPPDQIAAHLAALPDHPYLRSASEPDPAAGDEGDGFQHVIAALRRTSGVDFSQYRDTTIKRRTARRMLLRGFTSAKQYAQFIERDRIEADALYCDVLINVTSFFRDPGMFEDLKREVFPAILRGKPEGTPIRVWVPGCSTGQEAYSIAIALLEHLESSGLSRSVQIFATDLGDPSALDKARAGHYPASVEAEVSPERLRRFFTKESDGYRVRKELRDLCVFARQNVTVDPPFSRVDLVTCRNVLIYMSAGLQERLLPVFHFALNPGGFLVLGLAETVGPFADLFDLVNRTQKFYRKKEAGIRPPLTFMTEDWLSATVPARASMTAFRPVDFLREADRLALARYAPPSVLVNHNFEILQFRGRMAPFLDTPAGQPTIDILRLAKEGLFMELRSALAEAKATKAPIVREGLRVSEGGADIAFTLRILPVNVAQSVDCCLLVLFEPTDWPAWPAGSRPDGATGGRDAEWLRRELASTREYLQSIVDQQGDSTQELRSAHEEVLSSNEELQSTNEELETTKEELQSSNEELITVNEQFEKRNRELDALADDLSNFISSAALPMVTVGRDLSVRRLTPAAQRVFNLLPSDVGRSIEHIKSSLFVDGLGTIIEDVIASVQPWEREVVDRGGRWWLLRIQPYRTADHRIDGATIVGVDIDLIKRSHELMEARDYALAIVQTVREPLVVLDAECRVGLANEAFYDLFNVAAEDIEGQFIWRAGGGSWADAALRRLLTNACAGREQLVNVEVNRTLPGHGSRLLVFNTRSIVRPGHATLVLLAIEDATLARQAESLRIDAETLRLVDRRKDEFLGILAHELRNPLAPMRFALELMRLGGGNAEKMLKARQVLERQVNHMVRIVDDLLDVSRITHGKVELRKEPLALSQLVESAVELCRPSIAAARHSLTVSLPDEPITLDADPVRLTQVLVNLLNNAIKFTNPGGQIWLIAETVGDPIQAHQQVRIRVRDTGIGIAPDVLPQIFEMFMQGDRTLERTRAGLGVGLTLVRSLVEAHGGTIEVRSDGVGFGSEFTLCLPIKPHEEADVERTTPRKTTHARALKILVADDNDDGREMLSFLLTSEGHTVATALDGPSAVEKAGAFHPDVAILDLGMPGLNGFHVAEALRKDPKTSSVVLVALSGLGQQEHKARAAQAGFDRHFTKPVDVNALRAFLTTVSSARPEPVENKKAP